MKRCTCYDPAELVGAGDRAQARAIYAEAVRNCAEHGAEAPLPPSLERIRDRVGADAAPDPRRAAH